MGIAAENVAEHRRGIRTRPTEVASAIRDDAGRTSLKFKHRRETRPVSRVFPGRFRQKQAPATTPRSALRRCA